MKTTRLSILCLFLLIVSLASTISVVVAYHYYWTTERYHINAGLVIKPEIPPPVPEFPLGSAMPLAILPLLFYLWWKRKHKTP